MFHDDADTDALMRNYLSYSLFGEFDAGFDPESDAEFNAENVHVAPCGNNSENLIQCL